MIMRISSIYGNTIAKPMKLVDLHDVQPMADEDSIKNSTVTGANQEEYKATSDSCCEIETTAPAEGEQ